MSKTTEQKILDIRAALHRMQERQRKEDTRQKIILGATAWSWLCCDHEAARRFISHVQTTTVREQDRAQLTAALTELKKTIPVQQGV